MNAKLFLLMVGVAVALIVGTLKSCERVEKTILDQSREISRLEQEIDARVLITDAERGISTAITAFDEALRDKENEIIAINNAIAAGDVGVYVPAACPATADSGLPGAASVKLARLEREYEQIILDQKRRIATWERNRDICEKYFETVRSLKF